MKIEAQEQYSLIDMIFNVIFDLGPPGKYLYLSPQNPLSAGRGIVDFLDVSIDIFLEIQNQKYS